MSYTTIGVRGQMVVPVSARRQLGLQPGQRLRVEVVDGKLVATPVPVDLLKELRGSLAGPGPSVLAEVERDHRDEIEREEAELARWKAREHTLGRVVSPTVGQGESR